MPMVSQYTIPTIEVARNAFIKNHSWKGTIDVGLLYPIFFDEVLPGDTKQLNSTFFGRLNPTVTPVLDNIWLDVHYFFVPNRLVWDNWQKFMGERKNPGDSIDYLVPTITSDSESGFTRGGLIDYFSVPPAVPSLTCSSLVFYLRAYNLIWNEWYRSELLQDSVEVPTGDNGDAESKYVLLPRGKRQDYFTSAFTAPQLGAGSSIPLGNLNGDLPVIGDGKAFRLYGQYYNENTPTPVYLANAPIMGPNSSVLTYNNIFGVPSLSTNYTPTSQVKNAQSFDTSLQGSVNGYILGQDAQTTQGPDQSTKVLYARRVSNPTESTTGMVAVMNNIGIGSVTINTLRQAIALQQFLERDLLRGSRYIELILSHFGVQCPDYRLQRPEFLGGSTSRININPVVQTSSTDSTSPQGNLTGNGSVGTTGSGFTRSFTEHGVVIGLASLRVDLNYQQGVDRLFLRNTRYDYFFPTLAHLGMQGIYNKEIFAQGDDVVDDNGDIIDNKLFGYNTRYEEYRYKNSYITGKFRSSDPQTLDIWHLAEDFDNLPVLNDEFITVSDTLNRVMAVQDEPEVLLDCYHDYTDIKEVPMYGTPGLTRV